MDKTRMSEAVARAGIPANKSTGPRLAERRQAFQRHLQSWAYNHVNRGISFNGWIAAAFDSRSYALGQPVSCFIRSTTGDGSHVRISIKLSRQRPQSKMMAFETGPPERDYQAMIQAGSHWVVDKEWFSNHIYSLDQEKHSETALPHRLRSASSATNATDHQRAAIGATAMSAQSIPSSDWMRLGPPLRLLDLPREVRFQILDYVLQLPSRLLFDGEYQRAPGRPKSSETALLRGFSFCSLVPSRQLHAEVSQLLYSTATFTFREPSTLVDFLTNIGPTKRRLIRKLCLQFKCYDYLHSFTPDWLTEMLDVPSWESMRKRLKDLLSELQLEQMTIRLRDHFCSPTSSSKHTAHDGTEDQMSLDNPWVYKSVKASFPNARFESAAWPHRPLMQDVNWSWDSLMWVHQTAIPLGGRTTNANVPPSADTPPTTTRTAPCPCGSAARPRASSCAR